MDGSRWARTLALVVLAALPTAAEADITVTRSVGSDGGGSLATYTATGTSAAETIEGGIVKSQVLSSPTTRSVVVRADDQFVTSVDGCSQSGNDIVGWTLTCVFGEDNAALAINGATGNDTLTSTGYRLQLQATGVPDRVHVTLGGGDGQDTLTGSARRDGLQGGNGDDHLAPGLGDDGAVDCGADAGDTVSYADAGRVEGVQVHMGATSAIDGGESLTGCERVVGTPFDDVIEGDGSANHLTGGAGGDTLEGGEGGDTLLPGPGQDDVAGGLGNDTVSYVDMPEAVAVNLTSGVAFTEGAGEDAGGIEHVTGSPFDDAITLSGTNGGTASGGDGNDTLAGTDAINEALFGGGGDDLLRPGPGADGVDGGTGSDTVSYDDGRAPGGGACSGVEVNMSSVSEWAEDISVVGAENVVGTPLDDCIAGDEVDNHIAGLGGADELDGAGGDDTLVPGAGTDEAAGGDGSDQISYDDGRLSGVAVDLAAGTGADGEALSGFEGVMGSAHADVLRGDDAPNTLRGGPGKDEIDGRAGADTVSGQDGDDVVVSEDGEAEIVDCGEGGDALRADTSDTGISCESLRVDADGDGAYTPEDCADADAAIRPGATEVPGNDVDEDCDGVKAAGDGGPGDGGPGGAGPAGDEPGPSLAAVQLRARFRAKARTRVRVLRLTGLPSGATVRVTCKGKRRSCPFKTRTRTPSGDALNLRGLFKKRRLRARTRVTIEATLPGAEPRTFEIVTRKGKRPRVTG